MKAKSPSSKPKAPSPDTGPVARRGSIPGGSGGITEREARVRTEMVDELFRMGASLRYLPFVAFAALAYVLKDQASVRTLTILIVWYVVITLTFDILRYLNRRSVAELGTATRLLRWYRVFSFLSGVMWGTTGTILFPEGDFGRQAFLGVILMALATANINRRGADLVSYHAYNMPLGLPVIILLLLETGSETSQIAGVLAIMFWFIVGVWAYEENRDIRRRIELRQENLELIADLSHARNEADKARIAAEAGNRAKSEFLATMSHELRTPMNGILGMTRLLLRTNLGKTQRAYAEAVYNSGEGLLRIINNVLDFSRIEAEEIKLEQISFDVADLVEETVMLLAPRASEKGLSISSYIGPEIPARLVGDPARLRRVLLNLLWNALKFTEKGSISCEVTATSFDGTADRAELCFVVRDTGIGIEAADVERMFERFSQADASIHRTYGGAGLGLAICKRLIEAMRGGIKVHSTPGIGSTFEVRIPFPLGSLGRAPARFDNLEGFSVVVVDRPGDARANLVRTLKDWQCRVTALAPQEFEADIMLAGDDAGSLPNTIIVAGGVLTQEQAARLDTLRSRGKATRPRLIEAVQIGSVPDIDAQADETTRSVGRTDRIFDGRILMPLRRAELYRTLLGFRDVDRPGDLEANVSGGSGKRDIPSPLSVLVVDDVELNRRLIEHALVDSGHRVSLAVSGEDAVEKARQQYFDLILMDIEMPGIDGVTAARQIRELPCAAGDAAIIAVTAHVGPEFQASFRTAGMNGFVAKPIDIDGIAAIVDDFGRRRRVDGADSPASGPIPPTSCESAPGAAGDLTRVFLGEVDEIGAELRDAIDEGGFQRLGRNARQLGLAAAAVDDYVLRELAHRLERAAGREADSECRSLLQEVFVVLDELRRGFANAPGPEEDRSGPESSMHEA